MILWVSLIVTKGFLTRWSPALQTWCRESITHSLIMANFTHFQLIYPATVENLARGLPFPLEWGSWICKSTCAMFFDPLFDDQKIYDPLQAAKMLKQHVTPPVCKAQKIFSFEAISVNKYSVKFVNTQSSLFSSSFFFFLTPYFSWKFSDPSFFITPNSEENDSLLNQCYATSYQ